MLFSVVGDFWFLIEVVLDGVGRYGLIRDGCVSMGYQVFCGVECNVFEVQDWLFDFRFKGFGDG